MAATESAQALEAFVIYRDMGVERSTAKVAQRLGKSKTLMDRWSGWHRWVERAREHDQRIAAEAEAQARKERLADLERRRKRRISIADKQRTIADRALDHLDPKDLNDRVVSAIFKLLKQANDDERLDTGEATARQEVQGAQGGPVAVKVTSDEPTARSVFEILRDVGVLALARHGDDDLADDAEVDEVHPAGPQ